MAVALIGPDGRKYTLPDDAKLPQALAAGFREAGAEGRTAGEAVRGTLDEAREFAVTGAEGVLRGATAGLSDVALTAGTPTTVDETARADFNRAEMDRRRRENPITATVSELAGAIRSPLNALQPGVVTSLAPTTALGRVGANIVGGGAVGALYGAGNTLTDAALGSTELTAEKLIAGAGLGALLGGAGGGMGGVLDEGVRTVLPAAMRAAGKALPGLEEFADQRWLKAAGGIQSDIKKIPQGEYRDVANALRSHLNPGGGVLPRNIDDAAISAQAEREMVANNILRSGGLEDIAGALKPGMVRDEAMEVLEEGMRVNGERIGAALKAADAAGAKVDYRNFIKRFADFKAALNPAEQDIIGGPIAKAIEYLEQVATHPAGKSGFAALNSLKSTLQKDTNWVADGAAKFGLKRQLVGILRDEIDAQLLPQMGVVAKAAAVGDDLARAKTPGIADTIHIRAPKNAPLSAEAKEFLAAKRAYGALADAEKTLSKKTSTGTDALGSIIDNLGLGQDPLAKRLRALDHAAGLLKRGHERELGNRFISASDYLVGIGAGVAGAASEGDAEGALKGLALAVGHKLMRERGAGVIAALADKITKSPQLKIAAASFAQKAQTSLPLFGEHAPMLARAIATNPSLALASHMVWAEAHPGYAEKAQAAGFLPETEEEAGAAAGRATGLVGVAAALKRTDDAIGKGIDKVFKGAAGVRRPDTTSTQDFGTKRMRREGPAAHRKRMDEVAELAANPDALLERVTANFSSLADVAPGVSAASTALAHRAVTYLAAQIQKPVKPGPLAQEWKFNDTELFVFSKKLETVEEPLSVLDHAAAGTLTRDQVEALKAVYPTVYAQMRDVALERLSGSPKGVPYKARMMLGLLTGLDPDGTLGQAVSRNQAAIAAESTKPSEQLGSSRTKGAESLTVAQQYATPQQRREMGSDEA